MTAPSCRADIAARLTDSARAVPDTDWFVSRLYAFARELGASMIVPRYSRYVVDLNRPPDDVSLYPGQNTTGLCPNVQFSGAPVYLAGTGTHRSRGPRPRRPLLAALSFGAGRGDSRGCAASMAASCCGKAIRSAPSCLSCSRAGCPISTWARRTARAACRRPRRDWPAVLAGQSRYTAVVNGRFKGGYITRQYGDPAQGVEAIQLELAQTTYMDDGERDYDEARAKPTQDVIGRLLAAALAAA